MRILQVSSARAFGGGERHLVDLARSLAARGHAVHVAVARDSRLGDRLDFLPPENAHTLPLRGAVDPRAAAGLARLARETRAEIVHAHVARDYPLAAFAARRGGARLVITRHVLFPLGRVHRFALAGVARVIAVSEPVARALLERRLFPPDKISVVTNGVDLERIEAAREGYARGRSDRGAEPGGPLRVGTVGSLVENKGHDVFLRAASAVSQANARAEFLIVGDEAARGSGYRAMLEEMAAGLNLGGRVRILTRCADPASVLPSFDVFVSASRSEAFGLAMAEALACGVPVVATATEGARGVVEHGVTGLLVPPGDAGALASAVISLLEDSGRRSSYSARARESARRRFGLERMVAETERVYLEALSSCAPAAG